MELDLSYNSLGNDGALCLARSLPYSHWLRRLDLRSNNISEQVRACGGRARRVKDVAARPEEGEKGEGGHGL